MYGEKKENTLRRLKIIYFYVSQKKGKINQVWDSMITEFGFLSLNIYIL